MRQCPGARRRAAPVALIAALFFCGGFAHARQARGDPLESAECRQALAALNAREAAMAAASRASAATPQSRPGAAAQWTAARRAAATACLATRADPPLPPQRLARPPPIAVAPLAVAPASAPAAAIARTAPLPPASRTPDKPYAITSCDPGGCWANDGSRLNRVGPDLWGPRGVCTVQGTLVQCP